MIVIESATKSFPGANRLALDSITASIRPGEITGVVGCDGAGKTTLLRTIVGLLVPTSGKIEAFGYDVTRQTREVRQILGYMPQKFGLYEDLTILENLKLYAKLRGLPRSRRKDRFEELLVFTGLERFADRLARRLSGGMKQKLGLACALITTPKLLVLDEPGVGVDPLSRRELWKMVSEQITPDTVVIWSTSYLDEAEKCGNTLLLNEGKLIFSGAPSELVKEVEGRVVKMLGVEPSQRRKQTATLSRRPEILDVTIQGKAIRATLRRPIASSQEQISIFGDAKIEKTAASFEDGFIGRLLADKENEICEKDVPTKKQSEKETHKNEVVIAARGLTKKFGSFVAASNIEFEIRRGEIFGLLGPNGAGKSTTFKMLCGLLRPTSGDGLVGGISLRKAPGAARKKLGYMAQKFSLYPELTIRQNLVFYSGVYGMSLSESASAIEKALDEYDLRQYESTKTGLLPLGYKQRLALATATIHSPDALFLDEPTSGVDPLARREFWRRVDQFASRGVSVLVTTHFMDEAEYCDRLAMILDGHKIAEGTPDEIKEVAASSANPFPTLEDAFIQLIQERRNNAAV